MNTRGEWLLLAFVVALAALSFVLVPVRAVKMDAAYSMSQPVQPPVKALRVWPDSAWRRKGDPR